MSPGAPALKYSGDAGACQAVEPFESCFSERWIHASGFLESEPGLHSGAMLSPGLPEIIGMNALLPGIPLSGVIPTTSGVKGQSAAFHFFRNPVPGFSEEARREGGIRVNPGCIRLFGIRSEEARREGRKKGSDVPGGGERQSPPERERGCR